MGRAKTIKIGNTVIHNIAPPPMTKEQIDKVLDEYHKAGWAIINEMLEHGDYSDLKFVDELDD